MRAFLLADPARQIICSLNHPLSVAGKFIVSLIVCESNIKTVYKYLNCRKKYLTKKPSLPKIYPSAARPPIKKFFEFYRARRFPFPPLLGIGFVGKIICLSNYAFAMNMPAQLHEKIIYKNKVLQNCIMLLVNKLPSGYWVKSHNQAGDFT